MIYELTQLLEFERTKDWSLSFVDWVDRQQVVNKYDEGRSDLIPVMGMLQMASSLLNEAFQKQTRQEMQTQNEDSQWGMRLADALSDKAKILRTEVDELLTLLLHYTSVLQGRRLGVYFVDGINSR